MGNIFGGTQEERLDGFSRVGLLFCSLPDPMVFREYVPNTLVGNSLNERLVMKGARKELTRTLLLMISP